MTVVFKSKHIAFVEIKINTFQSSVMFTVTRVLRYLAKTLVLVRTDCDYPQESYIRLGP